MKENEKQSPSETKKELDSEKPLLSGLSNTKKLLLLAAMYLSAIGTMVFSGTDSVLLRRRLSSLELWTITRWRCR